jgi:hypothetical protein
MEDPGLRDPKTHERNVILPSEIYGRKVSTSLSSLPLAVTIQRSMREDIGRDPPPSYVEQLPNGHTSINVVKYIHYRAKDIFGLAHEELMSYVVRHEENKELLENLKKAAR